MYKNTELIESGIEYFKQIKNLLEIFGIKSSPVRLGRKNLRADCNYSIAVKLNLEVKEFEKFYKYIGFDDKIKEEKILQALQECNSWVARGGILEKNSRAKRPKATACRSSDCCVEHEYLLVQ